MTSPSDGHCNVQPNHLLKNFPAACNLGTKDCILFHVSDIPIPTEPTLTCSEVVERLRNEAHDDMSAEPFGFVTEKATAILHSWRERRVQELEKLIAKRSKCPHCNDSASGSTSANDSTEIRESK